MRYRQTSDRRHIVFKSST